MPRSTFFTLSALCVGLVLAIAGPARGSGSDILAVEGTLIGPGVECPQFRLADGETVSLVGSPPQTPGPYRLTGKWQAVSFCMQGRTFRVERFQPVNATSGG